MSKTQSEIAALLKKGQTTVGNWENGISEPSLDELVILSSYFDISLDILIKVDLAASSSFTGQRTPGSVKYDHSAEDLTVVRDKEDRLLHVLEEIKSIREEIARINARLPENPA